MTIKSFTIGASALAIVIGGATGFLLTNSTVTQAQALVTPVIPTVTTQNTNQPVTTATPAPVTTPQNTPVDKADMQDGEQNDQAEKAAEAKMTPAELKAKDLAEQANEKNDPNEKDQNQENDQTETMDDQPTVPLKK